MGKKKKISVGTVKLDQPKSMRTVSRQLYGRLATKFIPDKTDPCRKPKHRHNFREESDAGFFIIKKKHKMVIKANKKTHPSKSQNG